MSGHIPVHKNLILGLILCLFSIQMVRAQITSTTADQVDTVRYPVSTAEDPLFIFYQVNQAFKPGNLTATLPGSDSYNFAWSKYNPAISGFDPPFGIYPDTPSSTVADLDEGGYSVRVWNGTTTDTIMSAWVMQDQLIAAIEKTVDDRVPAYNYTCDFLSNSGFVSPDTLIYYDFSSHDIVTRVVDFKFKWTSDNGDLNIPNDTTVLDPNITFQPPFEDTWYILTARDEFGMEDVDSVFYESIVTEAKFFVQYYDKYTGEYDKDLDATWSPPDNDGNTTGSTDARLTVNFVNESKNGETFEWVYLDTLGGIKETETTYDLDAFTEYTYETADEYYDPYMVSISEAGCTDTFRLDELIFVASSKLVIPNVFSPNGDGTNDFFFFQHQSLEKCRVSIVDRSGKVVYKIEIEDIYTWDGWDGNLHDSNREAPEGQYYYVVEAMGYDGVEYKDPYITDSWKIFGGSGKDQGSSGGTAPPGGTDPEGGSLNLYTGWLYLYRHTGSF